MRIHSIAAAALAVLLFVFTLCARAAPGDLDSTFGTGGKVVTPFSNDGIDWGLRVAVQGDGKILAAGECYTGSGSMCGLARFTAAGTLDAAFGEGGTASTPAAQISNASALVMQSEGKIIVAGTGPNVLNSPTGILVRYTAAGAPDTGFGTGGKVTFSGYRIGGVGVLPDGKILVAGDTTSFGSGSKILLARYTADGQGDSSFGTSGLGTLNTAVGTDCSVSALILQSDGNILVAGYSRQFSNNPAGMTLVRYSASGVLDAGFGTGGVAVTRFSTGGDYGYSAAVQSDGKIVVAGTAVAGAQVRLALARFSENGSPDADFGTGGEVTASIGGGDTEGRSVAVQSDGRIIVTGAFFTGGPFPDFGYATVAMRFTSDGVLDSGYGTGGGITTPLRTPSGEGVGGALQSDGKFLITGGAKTAENADCAVVRYDTAGQPDMSFGTAGMATVAVGKSDDYARSIAVQNDGKSIVAGWSRRGSIWELVLIRCTPAGALDAGFGTGGRVRLPVTSSESPEGCSVAVQSDGKILVAGNPWEGDGYRVKLVRCHAGGATDTDFGNGGVLSTPLKSYDDEDDDDTGCTVMVQSDGKIVVAGSQYTGGQYQFAVLRYTAGGTPDNTFGSGGMTLSAPSSDDGDIVRTMTLQSDGKIVLAGNSGRDLAVRRFTSAGVPDASFGTGGRAGYGNHDARFYGQSVAMQADGKIVVAGIDREPGTPPYRLFVARFTAGGSLDPGFGRNGLVNDNGPFNLESGGAAVAVESDGKIVVAGWLNTYVNNGINNQQRVNFTLVRYTDIGTLDTSFGNGGRVAPVVGPLEDRATCIAQQSDGRILAAGHTSSGGDYDMALLRFDRGPLAGTATTGTATDIGTTRVTLHGTVNPNGTAVTARFDYGGDTFYGAQAAAVLSPDNGSAPVEVSVTLTDLLPGTTYHYRVSATGAGGTFTGSDATFTTPSYLDAWRLQWFDSTANSGDAADAADPDQDGTTNLLEFATGSSPLAFNVPALTMTRNGNYFDITYPRLKLNDVVFLRLESSQTLAPGSWSLTGFNEIIAADNGTVRIFKASIPVSTAPRLMFRLTASRIR